MARLGIEPGTSGSRVRRATDCTTRPGNVVMLFCRLCDMMTSLRRHYDVMFPLERIRLNQTLSLQAAELTWSRKCNLASNGGVMRTSILGIHDWWDTDAVEKNAVAICKVTHRDPR